jgi:hypothetical protein
MPRSHIMTATIIPALMKVFPKVRAIKASNIGAGPTIEARDEQGVVYHLGVQEAAQGVPADLHFGGMVYKRGNDLFLWFRKDLEVLRGQRIPDGRLSEGLKLT